MNESLKLGFKVGDYVEWLGDDSGRLHRGMMGQVVKASDNPLAAKVAVLWGEDISAAWVQVEFEGGVQVAVRKASDLRRVMVQ